MKNPSKALEEDFSQSILYEVIDKNIARITLNRPHRKNAIRTPDMNEMLSAAFERAQDDDDIKVVLSEAIHCSAAARALIARALDAGAPDNATAIVARCMDGSGA